MIGELAEIVRNCRHEVLLLLAVDRRAGGQHRVDPAGRLFSLLVFRLRRRFPSRRLHVPPKGVAEGASELLRLGEHQLTQLEDRRRTDVRCECVFLSFVLLLVDARLRLSNQHLLHASGMGVGGHRRQCAFVA